jgi:hypothetical protein
VQPNAARTLLRTTAILESATGLALLIAPELVARLLLSTQLLATAALLVARIAGAALLAIGLSCWLEGRRPPAVPVTGLVAGLLAYNTLVSALLGYAALANGLRGVGLWPVCALHLALALWCALVIRTSART